MKKFFLLHAKTIAIFFLWLLLASGSIAQTWQQRADILLASGIDASMTFAINGKIYLGGGAGSKSFMQYDPTTNHWASKAMLPGVTAYRGFGIGFSLGDKGYVGLGADAGGIFKNDLWRYNPDSNAWVKMADFPGAARTTAASLVIDNKAYVIGGITADEFYSNEVWEYDPVANQWTQKAPLPVTGSGIAFPFTFTIGSKGYMMGGEIDLQETTATYEYDPANDQWTPKAAFPGTARQAGVSFVMNGVAYCGLGMSQYTDMYGDMFSYDATANQWAPAGNFPGGGRAWASAVSVGGQAYVGTGWDFNTFFKDWWQYGTPTGVQEVNASKGELECYPNPASDKIHVTLPAGALNGAIKYTITDVTGRDAQSGTLAPDGSIDIHQLTGGIYCVHIANEKEDRHSMILVKDK